MFDGQKVIEFTSIIIRQAGGFFTLNQVCHSLLGRS